MKTLIACALCVAVVAFHTTAYGASPERDTIETSAGKLVFTFQGHATFMMQVAGRTIQVDPVSQYGNYSLLPKADIILITHHHGDHCDARAVELTRKPGALVVATKLCAPSIPDFMPMANGSTTEVDGITISAVPAYNLVHRAEGGGVYHPKGEGNGYVVTVGKTKIYIAGDTENTPEMKALRNIDIAFLPMNLPYTMTPAMVADAAKAFKPKILYPYHYGKTDVNELLKLMKGQKGIEVRVRNMP
jgi:L-ascorbate metabolism protein UlaG (beta-lactamase superfamily)